MRFSDNVDAEAGNGAVEHGLRTIPVIPDKPPSAVPIRDDI